MTSVFMTGATGRVGKYLIQKGVIPLPCDITDFQETLDTVSKNKPDVIIHLAALSDVDYCETHQQEASDVNLRGTYNLLLAAEENNSKVVMISSDHVFSGRDFFKFLPYSEKDIPNPVNFYGKTKLAAEALQASFDNFKIIRTSYLFDKERLSCKVNESQPSFIYRTFMYLPHFVSNLMEYVSRWDEMPNLLHISGIERVSWYKLMGEYLGDVNIKHHDREVSQSTPRPFQGGLKTIYPKLLPSYSYKDGLEAMK